MPSRDFRTRAIDFTITTPAVTPGVTVPLDLGSMKLCGIGSPASIGSALTMTFDTSAGTVATRTDDHPTAPSDAADYSDSLDIDGTTESLTITLSAGNINWLKPEELGKTINWPRWLLPEVDQDPAATLVFTAYYREF